jgi:hypothetical protein
VKLVPAVLGVLVAAVPAAFAAGDAAAQASPSQDLPSPIRARSFERSEGENPLRGSTLVFEQSTTTQTTGIGDTPQTYVPLYELWLSLRPRYWFDQHWSVRARFDYTKELTNAQATTYYRQDVFGDLWTDVVYQTGIDRVWKQTKVDAGLRFVWPTSLSSEANGTYVQAGARAGAAHEFEIHGDSAPSLNSAHLALRTVYLHTFGTATTATDYGTFAYVRQNVDEFSFISDQVAGQTLVSDLVWLVGEAGLQITPRLSLSAFGVLFNQWHYNPSVATVLTGTGTYTVPGGPGPQFTQNIWLVGSLDWLVLDEMELGVGYYNLASSIAPDGRQRTFFGPETVWWSPDARVFVSITANLDIIYDDIRKRGCAPGGNCQKAAAGMPTVERAR